MNRSWNDWGGMATVQSERLSINIRQPSIMNYVLSIERIERRGRAHQNMRITETNMFCPESHEFIPSGLDFEWRQYNLLSAWYLEEYRILGFLH